MLAWTSQMPSDDAQRAINRLQEKAIEDAGRFAHLDALLSQILSQVEKLDRNVQTLQERLSMAAVDIGQLRVKASIWGVIGGFLAALSVVAIGAASGLLHP